MIYVSGMESSVFDLRIKRDTTSSPKAVNSLSNAVNGCGGANIINNRGETHKDYDFAYDFDAPCKISSCVVLLL